MHRSFMTPGIRCAQASTIAAVGLSARMLAQSARRAGLNVAALDIFGDRDTRRYAPLWFDIGGEGLSIDPQRLFDALERTARLPRMLGFVTSSGLEPLMQELCSARRLPRLIGNSAEATAAVREPCRFFALLDRLGIAHPEVSHLPPPDPAGWLFKRADGCGGMHIEALDSTSNKPAANGYFQRLAAGRSMSALFVAARRKASVIGFAEQLSQAAGNRPFLHTGSIGPAEVSPPVMDFVTTAIGAIVANTGLAGLNSIDFLLDGDTVRVLEINARPSSTMTLYETAAPEAWPRGLIACHLDACLDGRLPPPSSPFPAATRSKAGQRVVFAPRNLVISGPFSNACLADPVCHDVPHPGAQIGAGEPVCTLVVTQSSTSAVRDELKRREALVLQRIKTCHEHTDAVISSSA
ncbi:ATP-grasp domain-containing protein [Caballeronia sp. dw_19]|uniref:ATP-grasp domain-containing protein n=1 Tax=Caballeronia sp. dw_19 TaxID=2719791 RepID=UPI002102E0E0|nr:ATP-grasp domain-containing protein [Caballeronia sp. dw_19]